MAMTDAYGDAADYRARTGPPLAGQAADVVRPHGAHLARPSAAEARTRPPLGGQARRMGAQTGSRCGVGDRNTALPPACDGLPGTPWLLAPRRPLDKLDLFLAVAGRWGGVAFSAGAPSSLRPEISRDVPRSTHR